MSGNKNLQIKLPVTNMYTDINSFCFSRSIMSFYRVLYEASLQTFVVVTRVALREKSAAGSFKFSTQMFELPLNLAWERDVGEDAKMLGIAPLRVFTTSPQLRHFMDCSAVSLVKNLSHWRSSLALSVIFHSQLKTKLFKQHHPDSTLTSPHDHHHHRLAPCCLLCLNSRFDMALEWTGKVGYCGLKSIYRADE